jgi:hypothetical protein
MKQLLMLKREALPVSLLRRTAAIVALAISVAPVVTQAHVVLDQRSATVGSYFRGAFRVGHGCDGSATVAITVSLPDGIRGAKPAPKPGWTI